MKAKRTKYKRTSPKTTVEYSAWNIDLDLGFDSLAKAVVKVIKYIFGLLYMNMNQSCLYRADDNQRTHSKITWSIPVWGKGVAWLGTQT